MLKCIINEIIEEWKIYYKSVTNKELYKKVRRVLYTSYLDKQRIKTLRMKRRKCSLKMLGEVVDDVKKSEKTSNQLKKQKNNVAMKNKRVRRQDLVIDQNEAINILMGEPININDEIIDVDKENVNEQSHPTEKNTSRQKKIVTDDTNKIKEAEIPVVPKPKRVVKTRKNAIVLKRSSKKNVKANVALQGIDEKLEFIKLGRNSLSKKEEDLKVDLDLDKDSENLKVTPQKVSEINKIDSKEKEYEITDQYEKQMIEPNNILVVDTDAKQLEIKERPEEKLKNSDQLSTSLPKVKDITKENCMLKKLFKKEKAKIECKRNSVFLENKKENLDLDKMIKEVFKKDRIIKTPAKSAFTAKINLKPSTEFKSQNTEFKNEILESKNQNTETKGLVPTVKGNELNLVSQNDIKKEGKCKIDTSKLKKISHVFTENVKIYDVKSSKYIRDSPRSKNDLYKKVIDNQRRGISQNEYKSSTIIPHIKSDDEDSLLFIEPEYCKDPNINVKVYSQNHDMLEGYFNICDDINIEEIFPNIKDISNDSPNKWM